MPAAAFTVGCQLHQRHLRHDARVQLQWRAHDRNQPDHGHPRRHAVHRDRDRPPVTPAPVSSDRERRRRGRPSTAPTITIAANVSTVAIANSFLNTLAVTKSVVGAPPSGTTFTLATSTAPSTHSIARSPSTRRARSPVATVQSRPSRPGPSARSTETGDGGASSVGYSVDGGTPSTCRTDHHDQQRRAVEHSDHEHVHAPVATFSLTVTPSRESAPRRPARPSNVEVVLRQRRRSTPRSPSTRPAPSPTRTVRSPASPQGSRAPWPRPAPTRAR